jgi:prepilin-type processing-associated H-X9-DG protein
VFALYPEYLTDTAIAFCPSSAGLSESMKKAKNPANGQWCFGYSAKGGGDCGRGIDNSYGYIGWVMDNTTQTQTIQSMSFFSLLSTLGLDTSKVPADAVGPIQFGDVLSTLISAQNAPLLLQYYGGTVTGTYPPVDQDVSVPSGFGNGGGNTVYRLREGIERFLITDINNPGAANVAQSSVWIMFDQLATNPSAYNHIPGGANVLYMDGHVEFLRYDNSLNGRAPANLPMAQLEGLLTTSL